MHICTVHIYRKKIDAHICIQYAAGLHMNSINHWLNHSIHFDLIGSRPEGALQIERERESFMLCRPCSVHGWCDWDTQVVKAGNKKGIWLPSVSVASVSNSWLSGSCHRHTNRITISPDKQAPFYRQMLRDFCGHVCGEIMAIELWRTDVHVKDRLNGSGMKEKCLFKTEVCLHVTE